MSQHDFTVIKKFVFSNVIFTNQLFRLAWEFKSSPPVSNLGEDLKKKWEGPLQECSIKLMSILISHYQVEVTWVDAEIQQTTDSGDKLKTHKLFSEKIKN